MKKMMLSALLLTFFLCLSFHVPSTVRGQITADILPLNTMVTVKAPDAPLDRKTAPKKLLTRCSFESQKVPDHVKVARFIVTPGQKYTLYDCHPALSDGSKIWVYLDGDTPLTNYTASYGRSDGFTRTFVTRGQQPWPILKNENASCDLIRYNITIAPQSEHNDLYVTFVFSKPGASTRIMLKTPPDADDLVKQSGKRVSGDVKKYPFLLTNIPGETPVAAATAAERGGAPERSQGPLPAPGPSPGTPQPPKPDPSAAAPPRSGMIKEAGRTSADAALVPYNATIEAFIDKNDYDTFRFYFPGGKMRIASRGKLDIVADLWDSGGKMLARNGEDAGKDFSIEKDLPAGTYYIQIRYMYHAGEGPYTLILGDGNAAFLKEAKPGK
jgi:hypothetical protein